MRALATIDPNEVPLRDLAAAVSGTGQVRRLLELARDEDLGTPAHDPTGELVFGPTDRARVRLVARSPGVVAGLAFLDEILGVFVEPGETVGVSVLGADADRVTAGAALAEFEGHARSIVRAERTALNLVARLCGVATRTAAFVDAVRGTRARICDTRKTTPGMRLLEKYAVRCGGGVNHRLGLHDAVLVKDNHLAHAEPGRLAAMLEAVARRAREAGSALRFVQVEVDTLDQFDRVLGLPAGLIDMVLLDNMGVDRLAEAVRRRDWANPGMLLEASGGVTMDTVRAIAGTGVDRVSVGGLTHQAVSLDLGLDAV